MNKDISYIMNKYNLTSESKLKKALENLKNGEAFFFGVSGKMGSGKDTCAEGIAKYIEDKYNTTEFISYSFATPLREETEKIGAIDINDLGEFKNNTKREDVVQLQSILKGKSVYERSNEARLALQYWGTDVRRSQDSNWWVSRTGDSVIDMLANKINVYISDARHPNEVELLEDLSLGLIRLDVSDEVRKARLLERDGKLPENKAFYHESEIGLDNYDFKNKVNAEKPIDEVISDSVELLHL